MKLSLALLALLRIDGIYGDRLDKLGKEIDIPELEK